MIRLLIADDHPVVRAGLARILADHPDINVVGEADDAEAILQFVTAHPVDVVLLDVTMPGPGFLTVLAEVKRRQAETRVLVLSVHSEDQYARQALRAGAAGYLTKDRPPDDLVAAIRRVAAGGRYVSPELAERLAAALENGAETPRHESLSAREYEVLRLIGDGKSVSQAAEIMGLSPKTVSTYRGRILEKLELETNADLIRYALQNGLVQ